MKSKYTKLKQSLVPYQYKINIGIGIWDWTPIQVPIVAKANIVQGRNGSENNLLEIMGLLTKEEKQKDNVVGCLSKMFYKGFLNIITKRKDKS